MRHCILLLFLFITSFANAQAPQMPDVKPFIAKLDWLIGEWEGSGWMMTPTGQKENFTQTESIQYQLDQSIIQIEGMGKAGDKVVHNALAIISYLPQKQEYSFMSYLSDGRQGNYKAEILGEKSMRWWLETPRGKLKYTIEINEKGEWYEKGEFEMGKDNWYQIFEMTLTKK